MRVRTVTRVRDQVQTVMQAGKRTAEECRANAKHGRPHVDQEIRRNGIINNRKAPNLLVDIEPVTLNDKCFREIRRRLRSTWKNTNRRPGKLLEREYKYKRR